jgi:general secretion pathway protein C
MIKLTRFSKKTVNLILVIAIAAVSTYWILQFSAPSVTDERVVPIPTADRAARTQIMNVTPIAQSFGSSGATVAASNISVIGVIAQGGKDQGVALLSVDNRPAMAFRAGETVTGETILAQVNSNGVVLEGGGVQRAILLPARQPPSGIEPVQ